LYIILALGRAHTCESMMNHLGQPFSIRSALVAVFHTPPTCNAVAVQCRHFHEYFVTHLPSSSLSPDRQQSGTSHKLPRDESQPHSGRSSRSAARIPQDRNKQHRDTTIVRIPIKSAKHHFGAGVSRGSRPYNEDTYQGGTIEIPAFAKRQPISLSRSKKDAFSLDEGGGGQQSAMSEVGDPQVFYFGVFDGHGGTECSEFLRDRLHGYIENCNCFCYKQFSPNQLNLTTALDFKPIQPPVNNPDSEQDNVARPDDLIMHDRRLDRFKRSEKGSSPDFVPFSSRPLMFIANNGTGCMTPKTHWELKYPDPGPDVVEGDKAYPLRLPSGNCSAAGDQTYRGETGNDRRV
jgi:hypothetical protein